MRIKPNIYLTADTHLGHSQLWTKWKHRKEGFEEKLITKWNNTVKKSDTVLHLGDLSLASKEKTKEWTSQLNGKKYLILGNHDGHSDKWYKECGFTVIPNSYQRFGQKDGSSLHVLFTHEPVLELSNGWVNIHGHLHGDGHRNIKVTSKHFDIGVDVVGRPVQLFEILAILKTQVDKGTVWI